MIASIGNVAVWVADLERSERFYVDGLGLDVVARIDECRPDHDGIPADRGGRPCGRRRVPAASSSTGMWTVVAVGQVAPEHIVPPSWRMPAGPAFHCTVIELSVGPPPPVTVPVGPIFQSYVPQIVEDV